ncbi:MAG: hypothetical protein HKN79_08020 [Flavobacteriales bacterium]|nr:hypothetical protein [Flavobacteriales bacterium]
MKASIIWMAMAVIALTWTSCDKEEDTIALIRIVDVDGIPQEQVLVRLYPEPTEVQTNELIDEVEQFTDASGEAVFDFSEYYEQGQAGFAVLNIEATLDTSMVEGIIKIEPETINEETLILQ